MGNSLQVHLECGRLNSQLKRERWRKLVVIVCKHKSPSLDLLPIDYVCMLTKLTHYRLDQIIRASTKYSSAFIPKGDIIVSINEV